MLAVIDPTTLGVLFLVAAVLILLDCVAHPNLASAGLALFVGTWALYELTI